MMKKLKCLLLAAVCFFAGSFAACRLTLRQDLVRIHVVANSDGERDQNLKLRVRDAVLAELENVSRENLEAALFGGAGSVISRVIYTLVGLAGLWCVTFFFRKAAFRDAE